MCVYVFFLLSAVDGPADPAFSLPEYNSIRNAPAAILRIVSRPSFIRIAGSVGRDTGGKKKTIRGFCSGKRAGADRQKPRDMKGGGTLYGRPARVQDTCLKFVVQKSSRNQTLTGKQVKNKGHRNTCP